MRRLAGGFPRVASGRRRGRVAPVDRSARRSAADPPKPGAAPPPNAIAPAEALKRLHGRQRTLRGEHAQPSATSRPAARRVRRRNIRSRAILSCADSRVVPDLVFDQNPGDLFVVRVAGNIVTPDLLASIEYGVQFLGAPLIVVVGHSGCGAVDAAIKVLKTKAVLPGPSAGAHHRDQAGGDRRGKDARPARCSTTRLPRTCGGRWRGSRPRRRSCRRPIASKKIDIVGGVYDIATGKVTLI